jgi:hypothetical protein
MVTESSSDDSSATTAVSPSLREHRVTQFDKQVSYGKTTRGYFNYVSIVPITERQKSEPQHPVTPRFMDHMSKRECTETIRRWRRALHYWDHCIKCWTEPIPNEPFVHQPYAPCWAPRRLDTPPDDIPR